MQYFGADGLGSVRQLYDASAQVIGSSRYDPGGNVMSQSGATSVFAFAGEQQDATGLTYLRARYYSSAQGRFTTRDTWPGDDRLPMSYDSFLYVYSDPVNSTDPTGYVPGWAGPSMFADCFAIHTGMQADIVRGFLGGMPRDLVMQFITAQQAVDICRNAYNQEAWKDFKGTFGFDKNLPETTHELMGWFVYEHGPTELVFNGEEPLTRELAVSTQVQRIRDRYYREGDTAEPVFYPFGRDQYMETLFGDSRNSALRGSLPIGAFIGSFWYQIKTIRDQYGRTGVGFRIDNDTTLESGSHIADRFRPGFAGSVQRLIYDHPDQANRSVQAVMNENNVISILDSHTRGKSPLGGGNQYQTYVWSERRDPCLESEVYRKNDATLLGVRVWLGYESFTVDPLLPLKNSFLQSGFE